MTAGNLDAALCSLCGPAGRLNGTEGAVALNGQLVCVRVGAVIHDLAVDGAGVALIKGNIGRRIATILTDIKRNGFVAGGHDIRIALEDDAAIVEAQRVVLAVRLMLGEEVHILQGQVCIVLNDALDGGRALGNTDGAVFEGDGGILQELESIALRSGRARSRVLQGIGVAAKINGKVLTRGHGNAGRLWDVLQDVDGVPGFGRCDRRTQGLIGLAAHHHRRIFGSIRGQSSIHSAVDNDDRFCGGALGHAADGAVDHAHGAVGAVGHLAVHGSAVGDGHIRLAAVGHVSGNLGLLGNGQPGALAAVREDNGAVQRAAGDLNIAAVGSTAHCGDYRLFPGVEGTAVDGQLALAGGFPHAVPYSLLGCAGKRTVIDLGHIPVHNIGLGVGLKGAAVDRQRAVVVVLDIVQAAGEGTALNGQHAGSHALSSLRAEIADHAGEFAAVLYGDPFVDGHDALVINGVPGVPAAGRSIHARLSASFENAAVKYHSAVVHQSALAVAHIVHGTLAGNGQGAIVDNGMFAVFIGESLAVQVQRHSGIGRNGRRLCCALSQLHRYISASSQIIQCAYIGEGTTLDGNTCIVFPAIGVGPFNLTENLTFPFDCDRHAGIVGIVAGIKSKTILRSNDFTVLNRHIAAVIGKGILSASDIGTVQRHIVQCQIAVILDEHPHTGIGCRRNRAVFQGYLRIFISSPFPLQVEGLALGAHGTYRRAGAGVCMVVKIDGKVLHRSFGAVRCI